MKRGLFALSLGTFGLGITEYVMMSILPDLANGLGVSITQAGHLISSYALGVCAGAPLFAVLMRNMPLKKGLLLLMVLDCKKAQAEAAVHGNMINLGFAFCGY